MKKKKKNHFYNNILSGDNRIFSFNSQITILSDNIPIYRGCIIGMFYILCYVVVFRVKPRILSVRTKVKENREKP